MKYWEVPSKSKPGVVYTVSAGEDDLWMCTCDRQLYDPGSDCSHIKLTKSKLKMSKLQPNEYLVSISGKTPIEGEFELDDEVTFTGNAQVVKTMRENRQDGTFDTVIVLKPYAIQVEKREK